MSKSIDSKYISMITPSRWFSGGMGLNEFRKDMLNDKCLTKIIDYPNTKDVFDSADIAGGVNYFLWDKDNKTECEVTNVINEVKYSSSRNLNELDAFNLIVNKQVDMTSSNYFEGATSSKTTTSTSTRTESSTSYRTESKTTTTNDRKKAVEMTSEEAVRNAEKEVDKQVERENAANKKKAEEEAEKKRQELQKEADEQAKKNELVSDDELKNAKKAS